MRSIGIAFIAVCCIFAVAVVVLSADTITVFTHELADLTLQGMRVCGALLVFVVVVFGVWWIARQRHESLRQRDGAWALREYQLLPWTMRILNTLRGIPSPKVIYDHSQNPNPYAIIGGDGVYVPPISAEQYSYAQEVEKTNRVRAAITGDGVKGTLWHRPERNPMSAPTARWMAGAYDKQPKQLPQLQAPKDEAEAAPQLPVRIWKPEDALNLNTRTKLAMGAAPSGEIIKWDMIDTPHLRLHGKTQGSGKTNLAQTLAAGAVRTGAHVIVLDRRRFKDWADFDGKAELIDTKDPKHFVTAIQRVRDIYQERDIMLGHSKVPNIAALDDAPPRIVIIVSEFGALCATAASDGVLDDVLYPLQLCLREAGATGVHFVIEDQVVDQRWPRGISTNAEPVTGYLPLNYGSAGGYYHAHKLAPYTFHYQDETFATWHMAPVLGRLLTHARPMVTALIGDRSGVSGNVFPGVSVGVPPEVDPPRPDTGNAGNIMDNGKWYDFILAYMATEAGRGLWKSPAEGVRDLARIMSQHETGNQLAEDSYVGIASKMAARIRKESFVGGAPLGTDISAEVTT